MTDEATTALKNTALIDSMFKAGAHFAYSKSRRHPSMASYIFGAKNKVEIFDLEKTSEIFNTTKQFLEDAGKGRKTILFVGGKNETRDVIKAAATKLTMPYVAGRWIGGTLTNFSEIKKRIDRLIDLTTRRDKGELSKYTKLERLHIDREITKLEGMFGGIQGLTKLPDLLFIVDTKKESIAVEEAKKKNIPIIGLLNSDCDISDASHYFIGNDAGIASITFFVDEATRAYEAGLSQAPTPTTNEEEEKAKSKKE